MMLEQNIMVLSILYLSTIFKKNPAPLYTVNQAWSSPRHQKVEESSSLRVTQLWEGDEGEEHTQMENAYPDCYMLLYLEEA